MSEIQRNSIGVSQPVPVRQFGPDLLRFIAITAVIMGHFFTVNTPYNTSTELGVSMFVQGILKATFCALGVPVFLMLSGYFCCTKTFSKKYYKGLSKVLWSYLLISLVTWCAVRQDLSAWQAIWHFLGFKLINYAWYIEMYIGLFLLIPFINIVINKIYTEGRKDMLIALALTTAVLTLLPPMLSRGDYLLLPRYWQMNFPVTLYLIGAYIRLYQPTLKWRWLLVALFLFSISLITSCIGGG